MSCEETPPGRWLGAGPEGYSAFSRDVIRIPPHLAEKERKAMNLGHDAQYGSYGSMR
jgi:hypothetical protein